MQLDKITEVDETKESDDLRKSVSAPSKLDELEVVESQKSAPTPHKNYKEKMKQALFWVHYAIFIIIISVSIYSVIAASLHPHDESQKMHDEKVTSVIQGLYKLIHMVNHLPNIGPIGINADPLDDIDRGIERLLEEGANSTTSAKKFV